MENIIFVLIWVGIVGFKIWSSAKNKNGGTGTPPDGDWLDEQWQDLIQTAEKQAEPQKKAGAPPPLPKEPAHRPQPTAQHAPLPSEAQQRPAQRAQARTLQPPPPKPTRRKAAPPPVRPVAARNPEPEPESTRFTPTSSASLALSGSSIGATSTNADRIARRQAGIKQLINGKKDLRKAILLREILDRPRAYDA